MTGREFGKFPAVFVRVKGRNGKVREFRALVAVSAEYCIIPKVDAYALGYQEAANDDPVSPSNNTLTFASYGGYGNMALITVNQVDLGPMSFKNVDFVAFDLPAPTGFDVVLGRSLLQHTRLHIDFSSGLLQIEESG